MAVDIVMPRMGLTMEEGTVVAWLKQENEPVAAGEPLLEIATDKSTVEIESPADGVLGKILTGVGETVPVGQVIGILLKKGESAPPSSPTSSAPPVHEERLSSAQPSAPLMPVQGDKVKASPAARTLAQQLGVPLAEIRGSGPDGRVVAWNVQSYSEQRTEEQALSKKATPVARRIAEEMQIDLNSIQGTGPNGQITRTDVERSVQKAHSTAVSTPSGDITPLSRTQRIMAERMSASFHTAPHFYLHVEADMRGMVALRKKLLPRLEKSDGIHLTFTDLLVMYCALVLKRHPGVLSQWTENGLLKTEDVNIGVAMDTPAGLIVPVIRNADRLGLVEVSCQRQDLAERAQAGKLLPQELELGGFTLSNLGMFGIDSFDAILNPPQAAILAVGRIKERALVSDGMVVPAPVMTLSLSVDHRVLDGAAAARFLGDLVDIIETPGLAQV